MKELQTKIKNYIEKNENKTKTVDKWAKDIAGITEKEWLRQDIIPPQKNAIPERNQLEKDITNLKDEIKHWQSSWDVLTKDNASLQAKLIIRNGRILELEEQIKADECDLCNDLQDENEKLKQQLKAVKTLSYKEVEKIIKTMLFELDCDWQQGENGEFVYNAITAICNLAVETVMKDKILKDFKCLLLENYSAEGCSQHIWLSEILDLIDKELGMGQIADEILNDKDNI